MSMAGVFQASAQFLKSGVNNNFPLKCMGKCQASGMIGTEEASEATTT